jgi:hypothetical protein
MPRQDLLFPLVADDPSEDVIAWVLLSSQFDNAAAFCMSCDMPDPLAYRQPCESAPKARDSHPPLLADKASIIKPHLRPASDPPQTRTVSFVATIIATQLRVRADNLVTAYCPRLLRT